MATGQLSEDSDNVLLSNGKQVRIRFLRQGEDGPIRELWPHLSPRTRYLRFLSMLSSLPDSLLSRLIADNARRSMAMVAEHDTNGTPIVIGLANLGAVDDESAEVGLVVRDDWQRQHVGTELARMMMLAAERRGIHRFIGHVLTENVAMRRLLKNIGVIVSAKPDGNVQEIAFVRR
ncbi:MAG TPA: GNAT family N-acetyltransferase [Vicinamibacterales bacterium]